MSNYWNSIYTFLNQLESSRDTFFQQVWGNKRLRYDGAPIQFDKIDIHSAQLSCSAQNQGKPILIVLPDEMPHRIPVLFATVLLRQAYNNVNSNNNPQNVIYFGLMANIREHLSNTYCGEFCLKEIFNQINLQRMSDTNSPKPDFQNRLPQVIFSNMPSNPETIIDIYSPAWCFVDLGNGEKSNWFPTCLNVLQQKQIPVVACIQNPLSTAIQQCEEVGWQIFRWPFSIYSNIPDKQVLVQPLILGGETVELHSVQFQRVYKELFKLSSKVNGKFDSDSLRVVKQYASSLEQLNTPYKFHEAECKRIWGIYSLSNSQKTAKRFIENLQSFNSPFCESLKAVYDTLINIHHELQSIEEPPLWQTLYNLCFAELEENSVRLLVFPSEGRRKLFTLALLAYHNFSTDDLASINVWLVSLNRFNQWQRIRQNQNLQVGDDISGIPPMEKVWQPLLVGIPWHDAKYVGLLRCERLDILLYNHQISAFQHNVNQWNQAIDNEHPNNLYILSKLNRDNQDLSVKKIGDDISSRFAITTPLRWEVENNEKIYDPEAIELFHAPDRVDEIAWLIQSDNIYTEERVLSDNPNVESEDTMHNMMTTDQVIHIVFREGFHVRLPQNATVQLVINADNGRKLDERSVRSLRSNDVVLFIHGQNRQDLYELILSRVHAHPSIILYVNLIRKWQEEISESAERTNLSLEDILNNLKLRGSNLETTQSIQFWKDGKVLCPKDPADLLRIAQILEMDFSKEYYKQIGRAATRLRGIHIGLARRLNQWLQQGGIETSHDRIDDLIDSELGISFNDFQDALQLLSVEEVRQEEGLFLISDLGQLTKE